MDPTKLYEEAARLHTEAKSLLEKGEKMTDDESARVDTLLEQVEVPLPDAVVEAEHSWRAEQTRQQLAQAGMTLDMYLESEGRSEEEFDDELREAMEGLGLPCYLSRSQHMKQI